MGFFDDSDEAPPVQMTPFSPGVAAPQLQAINFAQIMDDITGEQMTFVRGADGQRYLQLQNELKSAEERFNSFDAGGKGYKKGAYQYSEQGRNELSRIEQLRGEVGSARAEKDQSDARGLQSGELRVAFRNTRNRIPLDAPIDVGDINVNLPEVGNLRNFDMRYAAAVADLTGRLRNLSNTIEAVENTAPELIPQNRGLIDSFKAAQQRAIEKGFDIKQNGLDIKLTRMGLMKSTTALGAQIGLARERTDTELNAALQVAQLAQGTKQQTIGNMYKMGEQLVNTGGLELNKYATESRNELAARQQDLGLEALKQTQGLNQAQLNLSKNQQKIGAEVARRNLQLGQMQARPMAQIAQGFINPANQLALGAINSDNQTKLGIQSNELQKSGLELQRYQYEQAAQSDPFGQMLSAGIGAGIGALTGGAGNIAGNYLGSRLIGNSVADSKDLATTIRGIR